MESNSPYNSPSRKSRFRSLGGQHRPRAAVPNEPVSAEEIPPEAELPAEVGGRYPDGSPFAGEPELAGETASPEGTGLIGGHLAGGHPSLGEQEAWHEQTPLSEGASFAGSYDDNTVREPANASEEYEAVHPGGFAAGTETPAAYDPADDVPPALRPSRSSDDRASSRRHGPRPPTIIAIALTMFVLGCVGGYYLHVWSAVRPQGTFTISPSPAPVVEHPTLPASTSAEVDAAFNATKVGKYADARRMFAALFAKHPNWPSMEVEVARAALYQHEFDATQHSLAGLSHTDAAGDAEFLRGLLHMTLREFDKAEGAFAAAVAYDPARPDFYYFWGECLRREGKPQEAAERFRSALLRNQYETAEGLYQLKLWLSQIQADKEESDGANAQIDAALLQTQPSSASLLAAAARSIKSGDYSKAAEFMKRARQVTEPTVFKVILQDPTFLQEDLRPELADFYK